MRGHQCLFSGRAAMYHAYIDGRLYVRGADGVYCYDLRK